MRSVVFGVHDGVITLLGFVSGVAGVLADNQIIFLTGLAGMIAEGISMGVGEYQALTVQNEILDKEMEREKEEIENTPNIERQEVYEIFRNKGLSKKEAGIVTRAIVKNKRNWLNTMLVDELGLPTEKEPVTRSSWIMGISAFAGGAVPLISYIFFDKTVALYLSVLLSMLVIFCLGAFKTRFTRGVWWQDGTMMMLIAMSVAIIAYLLGFGIKELGGLIFSKI
jgi:VIT1/CCC1 family predicted Fe2+/Mn2+ transporter